MYIAFDGNLPISVTGTDWTVNADLRDARRYLDQVWYLSSLYGVKSPILTSSQFHSLPPKCPQAASEALPAASEAFLVVFETLPIASKALPASLKAFLAPFEAQPAPSEL